MFARSIPRLETAVPGLRLGLPTADGRALTARDASGRLVVVSIAGGSRDQRHAAWRRRVRGLASVRSAHVEQVAGVVELSDGGTAVVLEVAAGPTLAEVAPRAPGLSAEGAHRLLHDLATGLAAVHAAGQVHARIEPAAVVLGHDRALLRLGVEAPGDEGSPGPGSRDPRAPEREHGGRTSAAGDVWELAACLAWALGQTARAGVHDLDPAVRAVLDGASDPNPSRRPPASELATTAAAAIETRTPGDAWGQVPPDHWGVAELVAEADRDLVLRAPARRVTPGRRAGSGRPTARGR